jgi:Na+-driven multidrug efflux pump
MWVILFVNAAGISINAIDPQLRAGGDVRFVMVLTLSAVWLIRLPLTWLFCFHWDMGVFGIFFANGISLWVRAALGLIRWSGKKWMYKKV